MTVPTVEELKTQLITLGQSDPRLEQIKALEAQLALLKKDAPAPVVVAETKPLLLDIGCGKNKRAGWIGVDQYSMEGVDIVADVRKSWPWQTSSVDEIQASHFVEHLAGGKERCHFFNEVWRVLKPGAKATIIVPHCFSSRSIGDPTHLWPPLGGFTWPYLSRAWRESQAPHTDKKWWADGYDCDFDHTLGFSLRPDLQVRNQEFITMALQSQVEAAQDMICTLTCKK